MKVGVSMGPMAHPDRPDSAIYRDELHLADQVEPLGFDSLFALEHHFTGYQMSPSPLQLLSYFAGRTRKILLGTSVIVLPWHDPVRVAEQIALLDVLSGGRCLFGLGRGAGSIEYAGFRIPMEEGRARFVESAQIVITALREPDFEWNGTFFKIPRIGIHPRPISNPERRFYASSVSPESAAAMAKLKLGMMIIMQNEWPKASQDVKKYQEMAAEVGFTPPPPILLVSVSCAESRAEADERARVYLTKKWADVDRHYKFSDGHLGSVKGYESYGSLAKTYTKLQNEESRKKAADFYVKIQVTGTPDDCVQQIAELKHLTGMDHLIVDFSFGSMPLHEAELNMRLFADRVLPTVQKDDLSFSGRTKHSSATNEQFFMPA